MSGKKSETKYAVTQSEKGRLLTALPVGVRRVKVVDELGKERWRPLDAVLPADRLPLKKNGDPIYSKKPTGRRRGAKTSGLPPVSEQVKVLMEYKADAIESDPLVLIARRDPTSPEALKHVMSGLAEEAASIGFERLEAERNGERTSHLSIRRTTVYKTFVESYLKHMEISVEREKSHLDLDGPAFQRIFHTIVRTFGEAMDEASVDPRVAEIVLNRFIKTISDDEWQARVKVAMQQP
jgi:hypothetical protein